jgi:hypothetical protein
MVGGWVGVDIRFVVQFNVFTSIWGVHGLKHDPYFNRKFDIVLTF